MAIKVHYTWHSSCDDPGPEWIDRYSGRVPHVGDTVTLPHSPDGELRVVGVEWVPATKDAIVTVGTAPAQARKGVQADCGDGIKAFVTDIVFRQREVILPEYCPACGTCLREGWTLDEQHFARQFQKVKVSDGSFEYGSTDGNNPEHVIGYACEKCDHMLITGNELTQRATDHEQPKQPTENGRAGSDVRRLHNLLHDYCYLMADAFFTTGSRLTQMSDPDVKQLRGALVDHFSAAADGMKYVEARAENLADPDND